MSAILNMSERTAIALCILIAVIIPIAIASL